MPSGKSDLMEAEVALPSEFQKSSALFSCDLTFPFVVSRSAATITRDECLHLNDILGVKTLSGCHNIKHTLTNRDDSFHTGVIAADDTNHRSSWLMPKMARRMTKNSPHHVSKWRPDVTVDESDCARLRDLLTKKMGSLADANEHLPAACKKM